MTELPPEAQAWLARAKERHAEVPSGAKQRVRDTLALAGASTPPVMPDKLHGPVPKSTFAVGAKVAACLGGAALLGVLITQISREPARPLVARSARPQSATLSPTSARAGAALDRSDSPAASNREDPPSAGAGALPSPPLASSEAPDTLAAETSLLLRAEAALRVDDASGARAILHLHRARFARGQLRVERDGLLALVACELAEPNAREQALELLRRAPHSALASRLGRACGIEPEATR
jgi:hypothetical protein